MGVLGPVPGGLFDVSIMNLSVTRNAGLESTSLAAAPLTPEAMISALFFH
jgi:hypothetical protein